MKKIGICVIVLIIFLKKHDMSIHKSSYFFFSNLFIRNSVFVFILCIPRDTQLELYLHFPRLVRDNIKSKLSMTNRINTIRHTAFFIKKPVDLVVLVRSDVAPIRHLRVVIAVKYLSFKHIGTAYCFQFKWRIYAFHSK